MPLQSRTWPNPASPLGAALLRLCFVAMQRQGLGFGGEVLGFGVVWLGAAPLGAVLLHPGSPEMWKTWKLMVSPQYQWDKSSSGAWLWQEETGAGSSWGWRGFALGLLQLHVWAGSWWIAPKCLDLGALTAKKRIKGTLG